MVGILKKALQRNITFKSHGNVGYQAMWYFIAWIVIFLSVTIITGGVSMVIFFFVLKIIFPEGEKKEAIPSCREHICHVREGKNSIQQTP